MRRVNTVLAAVVCAAALVAGCGDDSSPSITGTSLAPSTTAASTTTTTAAPPTSGATLTVVSSPLGQIVADASGRTLYVFANDRPDMSNCTGSCLTTWPRYVPPGVDAAPAIDPTLVGSITVDGMRQATIDHRPLYYYAADNAPGDVKGHGIGGNWFAVRADGENAG